MDYRTLNIKFSNKEIKILETEKIITISMAYGTRRFNSAFTRASEALCDVSEQRWLLQYEVVSLTLNLKMEDHSWSAVHDCLFNTFADNLHIWRPTPPSTTLEDAPCP
jgi:hypothetical protein